MMPMLPLLAVLAGSPPEPPAHQVYVYARSGAMLFLSDVRSQGGVGGGLGVRDVVDGRWLLQADVNGLFGLGSALGLRLSAGVQRKGSWSPAVLANVSGLLGDRLRFPTAETTRVADAPGLALGLTLAPLRFSRERTQVSLLELSVGVGPDTPALGILYGLTLVEVGVSF